MEIQNIQDLLRELRDDNTSGATEFIDKALEIIKFQLRLTHDPHRDIREDFFKLSKEIIDTRPSMAPLINTIGYLIHDLGEVNKSIIEERLSQFYIYKAEINKSLELAFHTFLKENKKIPLKVMLISYSSTIINLLLQNKDFNIEIYVLESRPLLEGRKVAEILSQYFKIHLIVDAAMGKLIDQIDLVLIGVDSILEDGSIINKIGTYPLAVLADSRKVDVYAVADALKYNLKSHFGREIMIERKPIEEIYDKEIKSTYLEIENYYFDITPPIYFTGIISNYGLLKIHEFLEKVRSDLPIEWFKYLLNNKRI
ncbi:MAG: translation initiation factor eIF-2B [Candidatus Hodarchaeota archaeon]